MRFSDAQAARSRRAKTLEERRRLGRLHPISRKDLQAIVWRYYRAQGWFWPAPLGERRPSRFRFPPAPAPVIDALPTISRKKQGAYPAPRYGEGDVKVVAKQWPMARADVPVLMRDELGAGFHVVRQIGLGAPYVIRGGPWRSHAPGEAVWGKGPIAVDMGYARSGQRSVVEPKVWTALTLMWNATPKPPYLHQIWAITGPAGRIVHHKILDEIFEADPSGALEERFVERKTTGIDKEEYSPHGGRPFRAGVQLRLWERAYAGQCTRASDYRRWLPVIRRALRQERLDHGHIAEQRRLADLRALFHEHELLVVPNLRVFTEPYRRYVHRGGPPDHDLDRWIAAIARKVRLFWGKPLRRRRSEWDIEDLVQEGWVAALKAQLLFTPGRDTWKAYSALAISRACWSWMRWQASTTTISLNRRTYTNDRARGLMRDPIELDTEIELDDGDIAACTT
jgi:hypothetical protein